jgi:hypothetical protein
MAKKQKKENPKHLRAWVAKEIHKLACFVADKKERVALMRLKYERARATSLKNLERVKLLHLSVLAIEDPKERKLTERKVVTLEKDIRDKLFSIAEGQSEIRRLARELAVYEGKLAVCEQMLKHA